MIHVDYGELLKLVAPEIISVIAGLAVLSVDLFVLREVAPRYRAKLCGMVAIAGLAAAVGWLFMLPPEGSFHGLFVADPLTRIVKAGLLVLCAATVILALSSQWSAANPCNFTRHIGEYFALLLLGTVALMFLVSAEDMLGIFVALEFASVTLYVLAAFDKRGSQSAEAGLKYFLFGSVSAAVTVFGFSLIYGYAGVTDLDGIGAAVKAKGADSLLLAGFGLALAGFGFKVAAAPFHLWAPDVYEGAPPTSGAFIASASKLGGFFILAKFVRIVIGGADVPGAVTLLASVTVVSVVLGNIAAVVQSKVRRLLAYSAIAQAGYMLVGVLAGGQDGLTAVVYYAITYSLTAWGAFAVVAIAGVGDRFNDFAGLSRRAPLLAWSMMVFLLSLAGIPPLAGFFGKFYLFAAAIHRAATPDLLWLVVIAIAGSAVSLFYYLQVLKWMFVEEADNLKYDHAPSFGAQLFVSLIALAVIVLGCAPSILVDPIRAAVRNAVTLPF